MSTHDYTSPLMSQMKKDKGKLSLALLQEEIPLLHAGARAQEQLADAAPEDKPALISRIRQGQDAQERLIKASLTFVISLARKEQQRRSQWGSSIPLEDIVQEGMAGLIKGLHAYNPDVPQRSATNYLGQWITTQMRRGLESMEHSFTIPQETIERHRKIRAIRSRLENELERAPTEQEIVDAARDSKGQYGDTKMGRVKKEYSNSRARDITIEHVQEERAYSTRTGTIQPTEQAAGEESVDSIEFANSQSLSDQNSSPAEGAEEVEENSTKRILAGLLQGTIDEIQMPSTQETIIKMKYGLPPYEEEYTIKAITALTKAPKYRVKVIIDAFSAELTTPQSVFHKHVHSIQDDVYSLGIGWVAHALGEYDPSIPPRKPAKALTEPLEAKTTRTLPSMPDGVVQRRDDDYRHVYVCPVHGEFVLSVEGEPNTLSICNLNGCTEIATLKE